ncbi:beta-glucosidase [Pseudactinotalea sp.]|uniref:beta-glucosidase family protein n=1 Tax=Pseudactinotalea sp. TaxID=1926260 RepID=UPI003B3ADDA5
MTAEQPSAASAPTDLAPLVDALTLEQKVALLTGADFWTTTPIPAIDLRAMVLSDGPSGVRGPTWDERAPSLNLPNATSLGSAWDRDLARRYGAAAASEARRKNVDVVLGPTINLHRTPFGGRTFEAFSEDPILTAELAASYVEGVQSGGVAACSKHYVLNDSETDRFTVDVRTDERTLREVYLPPFEHAVTRGAAWSVMSSYNSVDGVTMSENDLLETPLSSEWGFDGVVISDWTAVRSLAAASAAQDLAMPGPGGPWGPALVDAVRSGEVDESAIDRKVLRILGLARRVGALGESQVRGGDDSPALDGPAFVREAAAAGTVLLRNTGVLPLVAPELTTVAVIGHNARTARTQGGGSATVVPEHVVSPLDGIRAALPKAAVTYAVGAVVQEGVAELAPTTLTHPRTGEPGLLVRFLAADGTELYSEDRRSTALVWFGGDAPLAETSQVVLQLTLTPAETEDVELGFATGVHGTIAVDGEVLVDDTPVVEGTDLGAAFLSPPSLTAPVRLVAGEPRHIVATFDVSADRGQLSNAFSVTLGTAPAAADADALIAEAAAAAASADVAIVVVGTNSAVESEGFDRTTIDLPGRQDDLVRAVAAANPHTVVVVNAGAPVALPWREDVAAIALGHFGGQEFGAALADVLLGRAEPGGRLATTWPATSDDAPVTDVVPATDGTLRYDEGLHIGYRAWLRTGREPAYPFGFGLGYTTWSFDSVESNESADGGATLRVQVTNTGGRSGKQVVQVYAERPDSALERPVRWLAAFASAYAEASESAIVEIDVPARAFEHWDGGWQREPGLFTVRVGASVTDLPLRITR